MKILVIGQTPPPYMGQAIMTEKLVTHKFEHIEIYHIRMSFSKNVSEIGNFQFNKLLHLCDVILKIFYFRFRYRIPNLYYMPAGPNKIPMYRDFFLLLAVRWLFKHVIFHFRAGGISETYSKLNRFEQHAYQMAYFNPEIAIQLSDLNPPDGYFFQAKKIFIIPNGIEDVFPQFAAQRCNSTAFETSRILFVGILREEKGVMVLIEAAKLLQKQGVNFAIDLVGGFESESFRNKVLSEITRWGLDEHIYIWGVLIGTEKWKRYLQATVLCFPSYFNSETFGTVIIEAMQFELPVVATYWRGIPSIVQDQESGYLVPIKDSVALADRLEKLLRDQQLAQRMGKTGRNIFLEKYTINVFYKNMERAFQSIV